MTTTLKDIITSSKFMYDSKKTLKSGVTLRLLTYKIKGKYFDVVVSNSHTFKVKGRWDVDNAGSSDGLRPDATASHYNTVTNDYGDDVSLYRVDGTPNWKGADVLWDKLISIYNS